MHLREDFVERSQAHHPARRRMSQSARARAKGKSKGRNAPSRASPPLPPPSISSSTPTSAPTASSGAHAQFNSVLARQQAQESKYQCSTKFPGRVSVGAGKRTLGTCRDTPKFWGILGDEGARRRRGP